MRALGARVVERFERDRQLPKKRTDVTKKLGADCKKKCQSCMGNQSAECGKWEILPVSHVIAPLRERALHEAQDAHGVEPSWVFLRMSIAVLVSFASVFGRGTLC